MYVDKQTIHVCGQTDNTCMWTNRQYMYVDKQTIHVCGQTEYGENFLLLQADIPIHIFQRGFTMFSQLDNLNRMEEKVEKNQMRVLM